MRIKKIDVVLSVCCMLMAVLLFLNNAVFNQHERNGAKSSLITPSNAEKTSVIQIQSSKQNIYISKKGSFWTVSTAEDTPSAPADTKLINSFINNAKKIRIMYTISDTSLDWNKLSLEKDSAICVSFFDSDKNVLSKVYFGSSDNITNRISLRTDRNLSSYETEDEFSSYILKDVSSWSAPLLFSFLDPEGGGTSFSFSEYDTKTGSRTFSRKIDSQSKDFQSSSEALMSLRHGKSAENYSENNKDRLTPSAVLSAEAGNGRLETLFFYEDNLSGSSTESVSYRVETKCVPSPADNAYTSDFLRSPHINFFISSWTFEKIKSTFLGKS